MPAVCITASGNVISLAALLLSLQYCLLGLFVRLSSLGLFFLVDLLCSALCRTPFSSVCCFHDLFLGHALTELFFLFLVVLPFLNISWNSFLLRVLCIGLLSILSIFMPCPFGAFALAFKTSNYCQWICSFQHSFPFWIFLWGAFSYAFYFPDIHLSGCFFFCISQGSFLLRVLFIGLLFIYLKYFMLVPFSAFSLAFAQLLLLVDLFFLALHRASFSSGHFFGIFFLCFQLVLPRSSLQFRCSFSILWGSLFSPLNAFGGIGQCHSMQQGDFTHDCKQAINRLKIPQGLSTLFFRWWSELPSRGGVHGDSRYKKKNCLLYIITKMPIACVTASGSVISLAAVMLSLQY